MPKRRTISVGILAALVGLVLSGLAMLPPHPTVSRANCNRIEKGMSVSEVEAIFGCPSETAFTCLYGDRVWLNDAEGCAIVTFDEDEKVLHARWVSNERGWLERFQRRLGWPWF